MKKGEITKKKKAIERLEEKIEVAKENTSTAGYYLFF
jgi:hypothetical protein